jgi:hypothetical protein
MRRGSTLIAISRVAAPCSLTAAAIAPDISLIAQTVPLISWRSALLAVSRNASMFAGSLTVASFPCAYFEKQPPMASGLTANAGKNLRVQSDRDQASSRRTGPMMIDLRCTGRLTPPAPAGR